MRLDFLANDTDLRISWQCLADVVLNYVRLLFHRDYTLLLISKLHGMYARTQSLLNVTRLH